MLEKITPYFISFIILCIVAEAVYSITGRKGLYEKKDTITAKRLYKRLLTNGNPFSFAYLAAEADWARIFEEPIKP